MIIFGFIYNGYPNEEFTDSLLNDVYDIDEWIKFAIACKINQCWKRFEQGWTPKLMDDPNVESIPANKDLYVEMVTSRSDYQNRSERPEPEEEL